MTEYLDITKPLYSEQILPVAPWAFVISRFHCILQAQQCPQALGESQTCLDVRQKWLDLMDKQWRFFRADLPESSLGWSWKKLQRIWTSAKKYGDLQRRCYRWGKWGIKSTNFQLWDNSDLCRLRYTLVWQTKNPWTRWSYTVWGARCCHSYTLSEGSLVLRQTLDWHKCPALATRSLLCFLIFNYILLIGVEMRKYINLLSRLKFYTSQRCGTVEKSDKGRIFSHFPPNHEPLSFFTQLYTS